MILAIIRTGIKLKALTPSDAADIEQHSILLPDCTFVHIVAALIAAGYTASELKELIQELDYKKFKDASPLDKIPVLGPLTSLILEKGIYEGKFFEYWIRELLRQKNVETFNDLVLQDYRGVWPFTALLSTVPLVQW